MKSFPGPERRAQTLFTLRGGQRERFTVKGPRGLNTFDQAITKPFGISGTQGLESRVP